MSELASAQCRIFSEAGRFTTDDYICQIWNVVVCVVWGRGGGGPSHVPKDSFENNNFAMHNVGIIQHIPRCLGNIETRKDAKKTEEFLQHPSVITTENTSITSTTSSTSTISSRGRGWGVLNHLKKSVYRRGVGNKVRDG